MQPNESKTIKSAVSKNVGAVSEQVLGVIAEQGFFVTPGSLAAARSACAELMFARAMIDAQTATIEALHAQLSVPFKSAA